MLLLARFHFDRLVREASEPSVAFVGNRHCASGAKGFTVRLGSGGVCRKPVPVPALRRPRRGRLSVAVAPSPPPRCAPRPPIDSTERGHVALLGPIVGGRPRPLRPGSGTG